MQTYFPLIFFFQARPERRPFDVRYTSINAKSKIQKARSNDQRASTVPIMNHGPFNSSVTNLLVDDLSGLMGSSARPEKLIIEYKCDVMINENKFIKSHFCPNIVTRSFSVRNTYIILWMNIDEPVNLIF